MRNIRSSLLVAILALAVSLAPACKSPGRAVHSTLTFAVEVADQAMADWNDKVGASNEAVRRGEPATVTIADEERVAAIWEKYRKALVAAKAAQRAYRAASESDSEELLGKLEDAVKSLRDMSGQLEDLIKGLL